MYRRLTERLTTATHPPSAPTPRDRWDLHRDLLGTARAQLDTLAAGASDAEAGTRRGVLSSITAARTPTTA